MSKLPAHPQRDAKEEQYATEGGLAAEWLTKADGINGRKVADLGAGNGILGIGAALLGASKVWLVEADPVVAEVASQAAAEFEEIEVISHRIENTLPSGVEPQTIIMNPPWGRQSKGADRALLEAAMRSSAEVIHLMHSAGASHIEGIAAENGWHCEVLMEAEFRLPARYGHHTSRISSTPVKCWRLSRR